MGLQASKLPAAGAGTLPLVLLATGAAAAVCCLPIAVHVGLFALFVDSSIRIGTRFCLGFRQRIHLLLQPDTRKPTAGELQSPAEAVIMPVVIVGDRGVGKSTVAHSFVSGSIQSEQEPTIGADFVFVDLSTDDKQVHLTVSEVVLEKEVVEHSAMGKTLQKIVSKSCGIIMVYSVYGDASLDYLRHLHSSFSHQAAFNLFGELAQENAVVVLGNCPPAAGGSERANANAKENGSSVAGGKVTADAEAFCRDNGLLHFFMRSPDDLPEIRRTFAYVIQNSLGLL